MTTCIFVLAQFQSPLCSFISQIPADLEIESTVSELISATLPTALTQLTSRYIQMSSVSTAESDECFTPTHTRTSYTSMGMQEPTVNARTLPFHNMTFIIRDLKTYRIISLKNGAPIMVHQDIFHYHYDAASHWRCIENEKMLLGFYNDISGT